jgi:flagellar M-ring protein FliF
MPRGGTLDSLRRVWEGLSPAQRAVALGAAGLAVAAALAALAAGRHVGWGVLYSDLGPEAASRVITALEARHVPFQLARGGTEVLVPEERVAALRIQLAGEGLPEGTVGFGLFDHLPLGASETVEQVDYVRALSGELSRAIDTLAPVASSRVLIALPQQSAFTSQQQPPQASVVVRLRPGMALGASEVRAITHLVAAGVPGLEPDRVSVVDDQGRLLAAGQGPGGDALGSEQEVEDRVRRQVASLVDAVAGPGRSVVEVRAELQPGPVRTTTEDVLAGQPVSQQQVRETYTGTGAAAGGVPGVKGQVPVYGTPGGGGGGQASYQRTDQVTNYQVGTRQTESQQPGGAVQRIAVTVFADAAAVAPQAAQSIEQAIRTSFLDPRRGDSVVVARVPFWTAGRAAPQAGPGPGARAARLPLWEIAAGGLALALALGAAAALLLGRRRRRHAAVPAPAPAQAPAAPAEGAGAEGPAPQPVGAGAQAVVEWVRQNPATAAEVVRAWVRRNGQR